MCRSTSSIAHRCWTGATAAAASNLPGWVHTHPTYDPEGPRPSIADQRNWRASADDFGQPYCGIIISHGEPSTARLDCNPWRAPMYGCWVAYPDGNNTPLVRADLTIECDW